jgi:excisionase family DNA binding protein
MAQGLEKGGTGTAGLASEMAVGFAIAQQFVQQQAGALQGGAAAGAPAAPAATTALPDLMTPAQVAQALGVSEADVLAIIQSNELKAKKIGTSHRIRRQDLDAYLAS